MTAPHHAKNFHEFTPQYSYQQHFEVAQLNLEEVIREERMQKRIRKHKDKSHRHPLND